MNRWSAQTTERPCQSRPSVERRERAANRWPSHEHAIIWSGGMAALGAISDRTVLRTGCFWALATVHKFPGCAATVQTTRDDDDGERRRGPRYAPSVQMATDGRTDEDGSAAVIHPVPELEGAARAKLPAERKGWMLKPSDQRGVEATSRFRSWARNGQGLGLGERCVWGR